jgi:hypothetical protein
MNLILLLLFLAAYLSKVVTDNEIELPLVGDGTA